MSTAYTFQVKAVDADGNAGPWSAAAAGTTLDGAPAAGAALAPALTTTIVTTKSIKLTWVPDATALTAATCSASDNTCKEPLTYKMRYRPVGAGAAWRAVDTAVKGGATTGAYDVLDLSPSTNYEFHVAMPNVVGHGLWSNKATERTLSIDDNDVTKPPSAVLSASLDATKTTKTTLSVAWKAPASDGTAVNDGTAITGYKVWSRVAATPDSSFKPGVWAAATSIAAVDAGCTDQSAGAWCYILTGATPSTDYEFKIVATAGTHLGASLSALVAGTTLDDDGVKPPSAIKDLRVSTEGVTSISLFWPAPDTNGSPILNCELQHRQVGIGRPVVSRPRLRMECSPVQPPPTASRGCWRTAPRA